MHDTPPGELAPSAATTDHARPRGDLRVSVQSNVFSSVIRVQHHKGTAGAPHNPVLPTAPGLVVHGDVVVVWLARNDWLLFDHGRSGSAAAALARDSSGRLCAVNDLTHGYVWIVLEGQGAYDLLSMVCGLGWRAGERLERATATWLAGVPVLVYDEFSRQRVTIMVDRSLAASLGDLLTSLASGA